MAFIPHKYYVSTSLYEFKEDRGSLQITIKVFQDDFINAIKKNNGINLQMRDDLNSKEIKFKISNQGDNRPIIDDLHINSQYSGVWNSINSCPLHGGKKR